jgi:hypothetical protein
LSFVRLSTVAPDLVHAMEEQPKRVLEIISVNIAKWAVKELNLTDPRIVRGITALETGRRGDSSDRESVKEIADELDVQAWGIQDLIESGETTEDDYVAVFDKSRAATALWSALGADALEAALDSVYEAQAARDPDSVRNVVYAIIDGH